MSHIRLKECIPGRRVREMLCGCIWTTSNCAGPLPLELRGLLMWMLAVLLGLSMYRTSQPRFCRFWLRSQRDVKVLVIPKSYDNKKTMVLPESAE